METKKFTQIGTFSIILLGSIILIFSVIMAEIGFDNPGGYIMASVIFLMLICLMVFYKLTIFIDKESISFKLGFGIVRKSYKISEIKSCKPVTNSAIYGFGIHLIPNGILYNISGLKAIELQFKNKKSIVRIGTNCPEDICSLFQSNLTNDTSQFADKSNAKKLMNPVWIILIIILIIPLAILVSSNRETKVIIDRGNLKISGIFGVSVPINEMVHIDTISVMPGIAMRTNGYTSGNTKSGNFRLVDKSNVKLYIKFGFAPYLLIHSKGQKPIYINFEDRQKTINLYNELIKNK